MIGISDISEDLRRRSASARAAGAPYVVGVAGSVAAGKSTFAAALEGAIAVWPERVAAIKARYGVPAYKVIHV